MHAAVRTIDSMASAVGDHTHPACAVAVLDPAAGRIVRVGDGRKQWNTIADGFGSGRIDGTHTPDELIEVIDITDAHEIVMATDGYIEPRRTLAESEEPLAERIARDPLMIDGNPQTSKPAHEVLPRRGHNAVSVRSISRPHFTAGRWKSQSRGLARNS